MTTFITGGTSALGRVLVRDLVRQGEAVRLLVRPTSNRAGLELPGVEFIRGDITDLVTVRKGITGCHRVCHLASVNSPLAEAEMWRVNREGTRTVLQAALDLHVASVVQVSSVVALGPTYSNRTATEKHRTEAGPPFLLDQQTRRAADDLAREYVGKGLPLKLVYPGFGYGCVRGVPPSPLTELLLLRIAAGKPGAIVGSGRTHIATSYYRDTVEGILLAHSHGQVGESYLLVGASLTLLELWAVVAEVLGKTPPQRRLPLWLARWSSGLAHLGHGKPSLAASFLTLLGRDWNFSSEKARDALGWQPRSPRAAWAETWEEYQALGWDSTRTCTPARVLPRA